MSWLVYFSKLISPDFRGAAKKLHCIQLVSIGISHYCEFSAWCLKAKGIPFQEHWYAPIQHVFPTLALRVGGKEKHLSSSSRTTEVPPPNMTPEEATARAAKEARKDKSARSTAVPVAVCPEGKVWTDSWDIATKTGLPDIDQELKTLLDEQVGTLSRQYAYHFILQPRNDNVYNKLLTQDTHWFWRFLWWAFLGKFAKQMLAKTMKPFDAAAVADCKTKLEAALRQVDARIATKTTPFLGGATIGVADIAVASLVAPLVNPPLYCGGRYAAAFNQLMQQDTLLRAEVERMRATTTGAYVMDLYAKYR